jgi:uncharacterized protein involved in exopolysaccharide biosynthesis
MNQAAIRAYALVFFLAALSGFLMKKFLSRPEYEATTILFPSNTHFADHLLDAGLRFGDEKESGEYIELLNSNTVLGKVVTEFKLKQHYASDLKDTSVNTLIENFRKHFEVNRSPNRSLHLTVRDHDPEMAARLTIRLVEIADDHLSDLVKGTLNRDLQALSKLILQKEKDVSALKDSLERLEASGAVQLKGDNIWRTPLYRMAESVYDSEVAQLVKLRTDAQKIKSTMAKNVPSAYMVSNALPPVKPAGISPVFAGILSGVLALAMLFLYRNFSKFQF